MPEDAEGASGGKKGKKGRERGIDGRNESLCHRRKLFRHQYFFSLKTVRFSST